MPQEFSDRERQREMEGLRKADAEDDSQALEEMFISLLMRRAAHQIWWAALLMRREMNISSNA